MNNCIKMCTTLCCQKAFSFCSFLISSIFLLCINLKVEECVVLLLRIINPSGRPPRSPRSRLFRSDCFCFWIHSRTSGIFWLSLSLFRFMPSRPFTISGVNSYRINRTKPVRSNLHFAAFSTPNPHPPHAYKTYTWLPSGKEWSWSHCKWAVTLLLSPQLKSSHFTTKWL